MSKFIEPSNTALVNENIVGMDIGKQGGFVVNDFPNGLHFYHNAERVEIQWDWISRHSPKAIVAENVHTFAGQGIKSSGSLMRSRGILEGMAAALKVKLLFIEPIQWIECYTLKRTKHFKTKLEWKKHLLEIAKKIAPQQPEYQLPLSLETADAFLIWNWAAAKAIGKPLSHYGQPVLL